MLAASCGKDIDDNCRGVNFDATRLRECLNRNQDVVSAKCKADFPTALGAIQQRITARTSLVKLCNWELKHLCGEVREDPSRACNACSTPPRRRPRTATRRSAQRGIADALGKQAARHRSHARRPGDACLADGAPGGRKRPCRAADIIEKLAVEAESDIDLAALKQQAADRIKARADRSAAEAAADRAATDEAAANPFRRRVRPGLLPDPAGLLPDDRQHRRRADRSENAALPLSDRRSRRIRRPARPQSDPEPAARRNRSGTCW